MHTAQSVTQCLTHFVSFSIINSLDNTRKDTMMDHSKTKIHFFIASNSGDLDKYLFLITNADVSTQISL